MGRYLRIAVSLGARVVGMDLSGAVYAAKDLTADLPGIALVQGDLLRPPLGSETFDHIYSLGVLDHTPDPKRAFLELCRLLRPGGRIVIWVYPRERPALEAIIRVHRGISTRLPLGLVARLSRLTAPIGGLKRRLMLSRSRIVARLGVALNLLTIGVSMHPDPEVRVCDTLDWYAPKFMSRHTFEEVRSWFVEAGLIEITDLSGSQNHFHEGQGNGVNVSGRRAVNADDPGGRPGSSEGLSPG
jgi:SAM-dependent methyltransferase